MNINEYNRRMAILHRRLNQLCERWNAAVSNVKQVAINRSLAEEMAIADDYLNALHKR